MIRGIRTLAAVVVGSAALLGTGVLAASPAGADGSWSGPSGTTLYVSAAQSPTAAHAWSDDWSNWGGGHGGCASAAYSTIGAAVAAAPAGSTVVVCPGTYTEDVTLDTPLTLVGQQATIDATGLDNGVVVHASGSRVSGFTVEHAIGEGILVQGAPGAPVTGVTISSNTVVANDQGFLSMQSENYGGYAECMPNAGQPGDCGEGIHLMVAADSTVTRNQVSGNTGGVLLTDEFGPTHGNTVSFNNVHDNTFDCGITLAGHNPGAFGPSGPNPTVGGVFDNSILGNASVANGVAGQGAGVLMATPFPGGAVYGNTVSGNYLAGNGLAGVTVHSHAPGQDLNGNTISWNLIGTNNVDGDPDFYPAVDPSTTGIIVAAVAPLAITVTHNLIAHNVYGIWTLPAVTITGGATANAFVGVTTPVFVG